MCVSIYLYGLPKQDTSKLSRKDAESQQKLITVWVTELQQDQVCWTVCGSQGAPALEGSGSPSSCFPDEHSVWTRQLSFHFHVSIQLGRNRSFFFKSNSFLVSFLKFVNNVKQSVKSCFHLQPRWSDMIQLYPRLLWRLHVFYQRRLNITTPFQGVIIFN